MASTPKSTRFKLTMVLLGAVSAATMASGCAQEVEPALTVRDFNPDDIRMTVTALGQMDAEDLAKRREKGDIDGVARLPKDACPGACHYALLDVYISNKGTEPLAPPVLRLDAPEGRPPRLAVSFRGHEISPRREGRIRWLVALYPEEASIQAHLSSSIFFNVGSPDAPAIPSAEEKAAGDAAKASPAPSPK